MLSLAAFPEALGFVKKWNDHLLRGTAGDSEAENKARFLSGRRSSKAVLVKTPSG
jgi:hypothetical protein